MPTTGTPPQSLSDRSQSTPQEEPPAPEKSHQPTYAGNFRCTGPQCEDTCCGGWDIPLDRITYLKYRQFPPEALGSLVAHFVSPCKGKPNDRWYGSIHRKLDGSCPFFGEDRLCEIQKQYGPALLSSTCSLYPRSLASVGGLLEGSLSLSCPQAARQVLLEEHSTAQPSDLFSGEFRTDNVFGVRQNNGLEALFVPIRGVIVDLVRDRSRPMWQRLLLIVSLCSRLDSVADKDLPAASDLLARYRTLFGQGSSSELDRFPPGVTRRLELAITLSNQRCQDKDCGQRFQDVFWDFIESVGSAGSAGAEEDLQRFRHANQTYLEPFLRESPFMLENYLLNHIYQQLFPLGRSGSHRFVAHTMSEEAVLLVIRYSWMTTLLTGVAGRHGSGFGTELLISTVQSFTRAVEHAPSILEEALALVRTREWDTLSGLATLLRT